MKIKSIGKNFKMKSHNLQEKIAMPKMIET